MSEKPQQDVSRETRRGEIRSDSERPDGHSSSRSFAPPSPTEPKDGSAGTPFEKPASPPPEKNKRSSFFVYLAVLFGAAFLMLLLAYFIQQRNNATAQSDLRSSFSSSRQELLEEIQRLEGENKTLQTENQALNKKLKEEQAHSAELEQTSEQYLERYSEMTARYNQSNLLNWLERFNDAGDYLMMGELVQASDPFFNRNHPDFSNEHLIPAQETQYLNLREELFQKSDFMVMERRTEPDGSESAEFPLIREDAFRDGIRKTSVDLYAIVRDYAIDPEYAARLIALDFKPYSGNMEILNSGVFKPSTVEWFEEIKADLAAQGYLRENEDGTMELLVP